MISKQTLYLVIFCCLSFQGFSQGKKKIIKNKISSVQIEVIDSTNKSNIESIKKFDKEANVIFEEEYSKSGKLKKKNERKFSSDGEVIEEINYNSKGEVDEIIKTKFTLDLPVEISIYDKNGELQKQTRIVYNAYEEKIKETVYDKNGKILQTSDYLYDNKGLRTSKKVFNADGKLVEEKKYTYVFR